MKQLVFSCKNEVELMESMRGFMNEDFYRKASCVAAQLYIGYPDMTMTNKFLDTIYEFDENIRIFGLTTGMEMVGGEFQTAAYVFNFLFFESSTVEVMTLNCELMEEKKAAEIISNMINSFNDIKCVQFFINTMDMKHPNELLRNIVINDRNIAVSGAGAGIPYIEDEKIRNGFFVIGDGIVKNGIIVAVYRGQELHCMSAYTLGWVPCGREHVITKMPNDVTVSEIDGKPATEFYTKYLGIPLDEHFTERTYEFPMVVKRDGVYIARAIGAVDKKGDLIFPADIYEGEKVQLSFGNSKSIIETSRKNALNIAKFVPDVLQLVVCANRQEYLRDEEQTELDYYGMTCSDMNGCSSFGEIALVGDKVTLFNCALVATAFREGEPDYSKCADVDCKSLSAKSERIPLIDRMFHFLSVTSKEYVEMQEQERERQLEEEVLAQKAANEAKSRFLSNMSHEIRTPINAILGMDEMILREASDANILEYAENIKNAGTMLLGLINDILDFSKIEAGKLEIIPVEYSLSSLLNDTVVINNVKAANKGLFIDVKVDEKMPDALFGDEIRIRQVLLNIFSNSVKYTEDGGIYFSVKEIERTEKTLPSNLVSEIPE